MYTHIYIYCNLHCIYSQLTSLHQLGTQLVMVRVLGIIQKGTNELICKNCAATNADAFQCSLLAYKLNHMLQSLLL